MNWPLVVRLSFFGLAMGIVTVFLISSRVEPLLWLVIFAISAYVIAKGTSGKRFQHGVLLGLANCVWVTGAHILLFDAYIARHSEEAAMMGSMPLPDSPRLMMAMVGPIIGLLSGCVIGLLAVVTAKIANRSLTTDN